MRPYSRVETDFLFFLAKIFSFCQFVSLDKHCTANMLDSDNYVLYVTNTYRIYVHVKARAKSVQIQKFRLLVGRQWVVQE